MKRLLLTFCLFVMAVCAMAQKVDLGKVIIDKDNCTITNKATGKTFNLYGDVEIVESSYFADFSVNIVDACEDLEVRIISHTFPHCLEFRKVNCCAPVKVAIVSSAFADFSVRVVTHTPRINR